MLPDERVAMIKYHDQDSAGRALALLHGSELLGEVLSVRASPPPALARLA